MNGIIFDIQPYCLYDGPGIRTTIYLKGCPLRCFWCHNPESQSPQPEGEIGTQRSVEDIVGEVLLDRPFFDESKGGVTLSGGEPTAQPDFLLALCALLKKSGVHVALETCGLYPDRLNALLASHVDLFLFDIKHPEDSRHEKGTGASNRLILRNFRRLLELVGCGRIVPRIPVIPAFNGEHGAMEATGRWLNDSGYRGEVHLMPYHGWARNKYSRLGRSRDFVPAGEASPELLAGCERIFAERGLEAVFHG